MPCDALTYSFVVDELNELLKDGKIDKITMPKHDELLIFIRKHKTTRILTISAGTYSRIHITETSKPAPVSAYSFCMNLRKNILGGIIESIEKQPDERVIIVTLRFLNELNMREDKRLICEIMGKYSNIILTGLDYKIYECLKHIPIDSPVNRPLLPGLSYTMPVQDKLSPLNAEAICNLPPFSAKDLLSHIKGLAPVSFSEALFNAGVDDGQIEIGQKAKLAGSLKNLYSDAKKPCVHLSPQNTPDEFFVRPYNSLENNYIFFETLNGAMDYYYTHKETTLKLGDKVKSLSGIVRNALKKSQKRINELSQNYQAALNYTDDKLKGDLITANIYKLKQGDKLLQAQNFYSDNELIEIPLDGTLSPSQNAQKYFKVYAKKKRALTHTTQMLTKSQEESEEYAAILEELDSVSDISELDDISQQMLSLNLIKTYAREKNSPLSAPRKFETGGFAIYVGKNSIQNERLTKEAQSNDIWLHVKNFRGSHVIIRSLNKPVPESVVLKAAQIAAYYSKAASADKVEVDYTLIKHVNKPSGSPAGKVVYKNHSTILVKPELNLLEEKPK